MWRDHPLDLRRAHAPFEPLDRPAVLDEDERRDLGHLQPLDPVRLLVCIDPRDAKSRPLFPREMREQALHAACGAGTTGREEQEDGVRRAFWHVPVIPFFGIAGTR